MVGGWWLVVGGWWLVVNTSVVNTFLASEASKQSKQSKVG